MFKQFLKPYLDIGHILYVNNWYANSALFILLNNNETNALKL